MKLRQVTFAACAVLLLAGISTAQDGMKPGDKQHRARGERHLTQFHRPSFKEWVKIL